MNHLLDLHRVADDVRHPAGGQLVHQFSVEQAGEVGVQAFVAADELVAEAQPRHQSPLL